MPEPAADTELEPAAMSAPDGTKTEPVIALESVTLGVLLEFEGMGELQLASVIYYEEMEEYIALYLPSPLVPPSSNSPVFLLVPPSSCVSKDPA